MVEAAGRRIDGPRLGNFRDTFSGDLILPMDDAYDGARTVWNGMIDRRPGSRGVRPARALAGSSGRRPQRSGQRDGR